MRYLPLSAVPMLVLSGPQLLVRFAATAAVSGGRMQPVRSEDRALAARRASIARRLPVERKELLGAIGPHYNVGSARARRSSGKTSSIRAISSSLNPRSPAPAFSAVWSALEALGMVNSGGLRTRNASTT